MRGVKFELLANLPGVYFTLESHSHERSLLKLLGHSDSDPRACCLFPIRHESRIIVIIVSSHILLLGSGTRIAYVY